MTTALSNLCLPLAEIDADALLNRLSADARLWLACGGLALIVLAVLWSLVRRIRRALRSRRPVQIHPKLAKYNIDQAELDQQRREQAVGIIATSTGNRLTGFRVVRQVEAVFVDGYRNPDEAIIAIKADAVERGANALLNVRTDRTAAGKCSASGDAVIVAPIPTTLRPAPPADDDKN